MTKLSVGQCVSALVLTAGVWAASPVGEDLSAKTAIPTSSAMNVGGVTRAIGDKVPDNSIIAKPVAVVPEVAGWLMMLVGFGLLGALNRRADGGLRNELTL